MRSPAMLATLAALRADPAAVLTLSGFDAEPSQQAILRSDSRQELLCTTRQFGKSTVGAGMAVHELLTVAGALVLLLSPTMRQSGELFRKAVGVYDALGRPVPERRRTGTALELANGSRLVSLPGKPANVRGFSKPRLVVLDEAAFIADELVAAVRPMLARSGGRLVMMSSPYGRRGEFYRAWSAPAGWRRTKVTADMVPAISPEFLEAERLALGPRWFMQEYYCDFAAIIDAVFDPAAVEAALENGVRPLFLGLAA